MAQDAAGTGDRQGGGDRLSRTPTPELIERVCRLVAQGVPPLRAAVLAGLPPDVWRRWKQLGRKKKRGPHRDLYVGVLQAEARFMSHLLAAIRGIGLGRIEGMHNKPSWNALAWLLERRFHRYFGRPTTSRAAVKPSAGGDATPQLVIVRGQKVVPPPAQQPGLFDQVSADGGAT